MQLQKLLAICFAMLESEEERCKFEIMYNQYRKLLYRVAKTKLHDGQLIEEAVSMAFVRIAENMHMVREPISEDTMHLLMVTVRRVAINLAKKHEKEWKHEVDLEQANHIAVEPTTDESYFIAEVLSKLPNRYKDVLVLKYAYGYCDEDVARILNLTVHNVQKITSRGKKKLKKLLEQEEAEQHERNR